MRDVARKRMGGGAVKGKEAVQRDRVGIVTVHDGAARPNGEIVAPVEADLPGNRCNDGAVDPAGRFWFGTMDLAETEPTGSFYCLRPGGAHRPLSPEWTHGVSATTWHGEGLRTRRCCRAPLRHADRRGRP